jgi:hypothetical protein
MSVDYNGAAYSGVYSVSGTLIIARVPGIDSRSSELEGREPPEVARDLFLAMLADADKAGRLTNEAWGS